jgi:hypothetical protein
MRIDGASSKVYQALLTFNHAFGCCNNTGEMVAINPSSGHFAQRVNQPIGLPAGTGLWLGNH